MVDLEVSRFGGQVTAEVWFPFERALDLEKPAGQGRSDVSWVVPVRLTAGGGGRGGGPGECSEASC